MIEKSGATCMDESQDPALVREILSGDKDAFAAVVRRHGPGVHAFVRRMIPDPSLASDLSQEVFIRAYTRLHTFDGSNSLKPWLYKIALNLVRDHLRRPDQEQCPAGPELEDTAAPNPETAWLEKERALLLQRAMQRLAPEYSEALALRFFQEMSFVQVAEVLGIGQSAAKMRVYRGLEMMVEALGNDE